MATKLTTVYEVMEENFNTLGIFAEQEHAVQSVKQSYEKNGEVHREDVGAQVVMHVIAPDGFTQKKLVIVPHPLRDEITKI